MVSGEVEVEVMWLVSKLASCYRIVLQRHNLVVIITRSKLELVGLAADGGLLNIVFLMVILVHVIPDSLRLWTSPSYRTCCGLLCMPFSQSAENWRLRALVWASGLFDCWSPASCSRSIKNLWRWHAKTKAGGRRSLFVQKGGRPSSSRWWSRCFLWSCTGVPVVLGQKPLRPLRSAGSA